MKEGIIFIYKQFSNNQWKIKETLHVIKEDKNTNTHLKLICKFDE